MRRLVRDLPAGVALLIVFLLLTAYPLAAQEVPADQRIREGIESYNDAEFLKALRIFKEVVESKDVYGKVLAEAYKYLAACQFVVGERRDADFSFTRALEQNPELELSGEEFNPDLVRVFDKLRETHVTDLEITSRPSMTPVFINGNMVGETPFTQRNVFKTTYQVRLERQRYEPLILEVDLRVQNHYSFNLLETCGAREISVRGMKAGNVQDRIMEHAEALTLTIVYSGCPEDRGRIRQMFFRDLGSGAVREVVPLYFPEESGLLEVVFRTPPQGWQPGRFEFRILPIGAADEEEGLAAQFTVER